MDIPQDLWPLMASFMDVKTKRQMRLANTKWFNIIKYNNFSLYFTKKEDIPVIIERLSKYSWPIELTFNKNKFYNTLDIVDHLPKLTNLVKLIDGKCYVILQNDAEEDQWQQLSTLTNLQDFDMLQYMPEDMWHLYPNLTIWNLSHGESNTEAILQNLSNLRDLYEVSESSTWTSILPHPEKLTYLHFSHFDEEFDNEIWSPLTNLRVLKLWIQYPQANDIGLAYLTTLESCEVACPILPAFSTNASKLTKLSVQSSDWPISNAMTLSNLTNLESLSIDINREEDVYHITSLINVKELTLNRLHTDAYRHLFHFTNVTALVIQPQYDAVLNGKAIEQLTQLEKFQYSGRSDRTNFEDFEVPDLTHHTNLTYLCWSGNRHCPDKVTRALKSLTNLESLRINVHDYKINFLADLTKLTTLSIEDEINNNKYFWNDIPKLTNLLELSLMYIDKDDRLLTLQNLTKLKISSASKSFDGRHFTALTSLQTISFKGHGDQLVHRKELTRLLPYLYEYKYNAGDESGYESFDDGYDSDY